MKRARKYQIKLINTIMPGYFRDLNNVLTYGKKAPRSKERIWINPYNCSKMLTGETIADTFGKEARDLSGYIVNQSWPHDKAEPLHKNKKIRACFRRWLNDVSWQRTGIFQHMVNEIRKNGGRKDGCQTFDELKVRYKKLDHIYSQVEKDGRLKSQKELFNDNFREEGGVLIHIGPGGELYFGDGGNHRFAIGLILELALPAVLGCVHHTAIGHLYKLRQPIDPEVIQMPDGYANKFFD